MVLAAIPVVVVYATLSLNDGQGGVFGLLADSVAHVVDMVMLVFGDTPLAIETWGV